ncbi:MAG: FKBP-type peptidyl-prolyl cis-trans isomerase [Planctomycetaceae bacterium]
MKTSILALLCAAALPVVATAQKKTPAKTAAPKGAKKPVKKKPAPLPFKSMTDNISYGIGLDFGQRLHGTLFSPRGALRRSPVTVDKQKLAAALTIDTRLYKNLRGQGLKINESRLREGFDAAFSDKKAKLSRTQLGEVFALAQKQIVEARKKMAEKNKKDGAAFLAKNKTRKGVKTTKSGLQYEVLKAGTGKQPKATDLVVVHYRGTLLDGTEFDSSHKRKMPATFQVNRVIKGWTEALQLMKKGAKWKLYIPSELAYSERGSGGSIGPHATLTFEVELIDIKKPPKFDPRKKP